MKKLFTLLFVLAAFVGCSDDFDDSDLWNKVDDLDNRVTTLEQLVNQLNKDISYVQTIASAVDTDNLIVGYSSNGSGWEISFLNGETISVLNGSDGADAPVITVVEADGVYYWATKVGDADPVPMEVNGEYLRVTGEDGSNGVTPTLGVDEYGYWTVDKGDGNGPQQILDEEGEPVLADLSGSYTMFSDVIDNGSYVIFILADGTELYIPKVVRTVVVVDGVDGTQYFQYGESITYKLTLDGVTSYTAAVSNGWTINRSTADSTITVTAPLEVAITLGIAQKNSIVTINALGQDGGLLVEFDAYAYEPRTLTFEDGVNSNLPSDYWASLIDSQQYNGPLLYADGANYSWYDEGYTYLSSHLLTNWGATAYYNGGEAISNYFDLDLDNGDSDRQLSVYYRNSAGYGGYDNSKNFCVHFGYDDGYGFSAGLPAIAFGDGGERVIAEMYVTSTTYVVNNLVNGTPPLWEGDEGVKPLPANGYMEIIAIGFNAKNDTTAVTTFTLAKGSGINNIVTEWTPWDLSVLGAVQRVEFNITGGPETTEFSPYGYIRPAYFAFDNVTIWY
ncbi:MAG: DUF4988 and DUF4465 domain-containing protein [Rikenellaceae bacterium]|nr:DUF4988 and DUF4465 domain-containing protein [Rikenellaceae bacterium]